MIFDATGTIIDSDLSLRTPTLMTSLRALTDSGMALFLVSDVAVELVELNGIPKDVFIPLDVPPSKLAVFQDILDRHSLKPEEVLCIGDRADDEGYAAEDLRIRFIQVSEYRSSKSCKPSTSEQNAQLEKELAEIFGEDKISGKTKAVVSQPKAAPLSDLPLPKPPKRAGVGTTQQKVEPKKMFTR